MGKALLLILLFPPLFMQPVLFLQMNRSSGTEIHDRYGNVWYIHGATWVEHGLYFDYGDYVQIPHTEKLDALSTQIAVSGKFKLTNKTQFGQMIFAKGPFNRLFVSSYDKLTFSVDIGTIYPYEVISNITIETDKWYRCTAIYRVDRDSSDIFLYINGRLTASYSLSGQYPMQAGTHNVTLGCNSEHNAFFFNGVLNYIEVESSRRSIMHTPS
jgi:hypothetical protein